MLKIYKRLRTNTPQYWHWLSFGQLLVMCIFFLYFILQIFYNKYDTLKYNTYLKCKKCHYLNANGIMDWVFQSALHICHLSCSVDNYHWASHVSEHFNVQGRAFICKMKHLELSKYAICNCS